MQIKIQQNIINAHRDALPHGDAKLPDVPNDISLLLCRVNAKYGFFEHKLNQQFRILLLVITVHSTRHFC